MEVIVVERSGWQRNCCGEASEWKTKEIKDKDEMGNNQWSST